MSFESSVISWGLRTIWTILTAPTSFDRKQSTLLHFSKVMSMSVDLSLVKNKPMKHNIKTIQIIQCISKWGSKGDWENREGDWLHGKGDREKKSRKCLWSLDESSRFLGHLWLFSQLELQQLKMNMEKNAKGKQRILLLRST